jgi:hypothetical protein
MKKAQVVVGWEPIETAPRKVSPNSPVDLWVTWPASPISFGIADAFRVVDCWRKNWGSGPWVHMHQGKVLELDAAYITHWIRIPRPEQKKRSTK